MNIKKALLAFSAFAATTATAAIITNDYGRVAFLSDIPTVQSWATASRKPTYTAAEVGAYPNSSGETLALQVAAIGAHLNAEDAHFVSTNYDSVTRIPDAYVEICISNSWIRIWSEMTRWNAFTGLDFDWSTWDGFHSWSTNVESELSFKADRAWGVYDSETGGYSPAGFTQISSSNILIAAGMAYQRKITTSGSVWVLQSNSGVAQLGGDTNGYFRIMDSNNTVQFEILKAGQRDIACDASGITLDTSTTPNDVIVPYSIVAVTHPLLYITERLEENVRDWRREDDPNCIATVTWTGSSGAYVATVHPKQVYNSMFIRASFDNGGETVIRNNAPVEMSSIIINGQKYYLGVADFNGTNVLTLSITPPAQ